MKKEDALKQFEEKLDSLDRDGYLEDYDNIDKIILDESLINNKYLTNQLINDSETLSIIRKINTSISVVDINTFVSILEESKDLIDIFGQGWSSEDVKDSIRTRILEPISNLELKLALAKNGAFLLMDLIDTKLKQDRFEYEK